MSRNPRSRSPWVGVAVLLVAAVVWWFGAGGSGPLDSEPLPDDRVAPVPAGGIPPCSPGDLPAEVDEVVDDIEAGGPYEHPRNDGVPFYNRERLLPEQAEGYYREFTVQTPGLDHRGARRIVTGGPSETDPDAWFYTDDHYESFCRFAP